MFVGVFVHVCLSVYVYLHRVNDISQIFKNLSILRRVKSSSCVTKCFAIYLSVYLFFFMFLFVLFCLCIVSLFVAILM